MTIYLSKSYCDLCEKEKEAKKEPDGLWVCRECGKKYPIKPNEGN